MSVKAHKRFGDEVEAQNMAMWLANKFEGAVPFVTGVGAEVWEAGATLPEVGDVWVLEP